MLQNADPTEKLCSVESYIKYHDFGSVKQVTLFIAVGSQFRGDTTYSYCLQDFLKLFFGPCIFV